jgi:hypothetical protein
MKMEIEDDTALTAKGIQSTLNEIGRRILDIHDIDGIENPRAIAIQSFVVCYIREHEEEFEQADDGGYIYTGGD